MTKQIRFNRRTMLYGGIAAASGIALSRLGALGRPALVLGTEHDAEARNHLADVAAQNGKRGFPLDGESGEEVVTGWRGFGAGVVAGAAALSTIFWLVGSQSNALFSLPPHWHIVIGGFAFGTVFMATDPVSSAFTNQGRWIYGFGIGVMVVLVRVVNPAYPEGAMMAILLANVFAPVIDYFVLEANIKRRKIRNGT